ncbi:hypothetical protein SAY87_011287 [Trapa incisa]|uniref:Uncharacterized protein n=2 Tax=Trapa TaxID=22665 RepID=A0AAN7MCX8_TRANT|nr:hypothetical protein SAY87_011287 [Trapa incisa]KAK4794588.1 hypothetical protein SAY86_012582 [Trapa natans]
MRGGGGGGGSVYWGFKGGDSRGIVVIFGWVSLQDSQLRSFVELYSSLGWNSLICHAGFLSAFYPEKAASLAFFVLNELREELRIKPCPVVFAAFSAGSKACMYKVFQIIERSGKGHLNWDAYPLVRNCISGVIFDSSPIDITNDLGSRFAMNGSILGRPGPSKVVSWLAKGVSSALDALYLTRFESQRAQYWQNLHSSVYIGAPYLIVCSEDDHLAPYGTLCTFVQTLQGSGADAKIVNLRGSTHIGHYKNYPIQYRSAVASFLETAVSSVFRRKVRRLEEERIEGEHDEISELICDLQTAAVNSNKCLRNTVSGADDNFFFPPNSTHFNGRASEDGPRETPSSNLALLQNSPSISGHSILGQMLFDVCVPKNVEGWDIKFSGSLNGQPYASYRKLSPLHTNKCIRRSRL